MCKKTLFVRNFELIDNLSLRTGIRIVSISKSDDYKDNYSKIIWNFNSSIITREMLMKTIPDITIFFKMDIDYGYNNGKFFAKIKVYICNNFNDEIAKNKFLENYEDVNNLYNFLLEDPLRYKNTESDKEFIKTASVSILSSKIDTKDERYNYKFRPKESVELSLELLRELKKYTSGDENN